MLDGGSGCTSGNFSLPCARAPRGAVPLASDAVLRFPAAHGRPQPRLPCLLQAPRPLLGAPGQRCRPCCGSRRSRPRRAAAGRTRRVARRPLGCYASNLWSEGVWFSSAPRHLAACQPAQHECLMQTADRQGLLRRLMALDDAFGRAHSPVSVPGHKDHICPAALPTPPCDPSAQSSPSFLGPAPFQRSLGAHTIAGPPCLQGALQPFFHRMHTFPPLWN